MDFRVNKKYGQDDRLLEDVRAINEDLNSIRRELQIIEKQAKEVRKEIPGDEFLGI